MMDLVIVLAPFVDEATMTKTFELIRPNLEVRAQNKNATLLDFFSVTSNVSVLGKI